ncbi:hypothetical protein QR680_017006 [Steinernema hermaphroditum]|uniref:Uncharacterized protein n=1 Tax=Steinernema hermaphroditum TaxID=289476 RepID=A0AA39LNC8_9BILA|nr:hypothetical protein QR680_017006 [Steinernema hermaphroditum]
MQFSIRFALLVIFAGGVLLWTVFLLNRGSELVAISPLRVENDDSNRHPSDSVFKRHFSVEGIQCSPFFEASRNYPTRIKLNASEPLRTDCLSIFGRHHFSATALSEEEARFPVAFARVVYKDYYLLEQMLAVQYAPQNTFCFAVDRKSPNELKTSLRNLAHCFDNVFILAEEFDLDSLGHNMNRAHWECVKAARNASWKYVFLLQILNGTNDVESERFPEYSRISENVTFESLGLFKNGSFNSKERLRLAKGGVQSAFSREAVDFILQKLNIENLIDELNRRDQFVDEIFAATLNTDPRIALPGGRSETFNGQKIGQITKHALWFDATRCRSKMMRHSVCVFGTEDLSEVAKAPQLFLNKMLPEFDFLAISCLAELVHNRSVDGVSSLDPSLFSTL